MQILRLLGALTALALAPLLAVQAHVNAGGSAVEQAIGWNGFQLADRAMSQVEASQIGGQVQLVASPAAIEIARRAYAQEPFATDALFVIGAMDRAHGLDIYRASLALERRNRIIAAMLLQDAARRNDLPATLTLIDRLSRLRPEFSSEFVKAFSGSLAEPQALPLIKRALAENPPWATAFWRGVPRDGPALDNFLALRRSLSAGSDVQSDAALIKALVEAGRYGEAFEFRTTLAEGDERVIGGSAAQYPPLDWQLAQSRSAQARSSGAGQLEIYVESGTGGELARKLVRLSPGVTVLSGRLELQQGTGSVEAVLTCAAGKPEPRWAAQPIEDAQGWEISPTSCPYAWLILKGSAWDSQLPLRSTISQLALAEN